MISRAGSIVSRRVILGIDPGSRITGFGVIAHENGRNFYLSSGCIRLDSKDWLEKCRLLQNSLQQIIREYQPTEAAIERIFMHVNPSSALKLGQARGAAMTALCQANVNLAEYTARQVKQAVVGFGAAQKNQVQEMVQVLLQLSGKPQADAADALAIALCHAHFSASTHGLVTQIRHQRWKI